MKRKLKKKYKDINFSRSFTFISFKNENGYIIDKILGTYSYEFSKKVYGGPKIVSGYALRENDTILSKISIKNSSKY